MSGNVQLIDPLNTNIPTYQDEGGNDVPILVNGVPQYQDMFIFAELVAESRGRTVLETNTKGLKANLVRTGLDENVIVNFLGPNQNNPDSFDDNSFTTRYYDGSVTDGTQHDSFGITKIKTLINSSYIPQVDIEFTDIRGLSFFNREDSPYRILFNFPPPIFYLTIKGQYGKALQYQMHLVKYTTEFKSSTGNYVINAKFIAITYAPLTDILFKYVLNFGLFDSENISVEINNQRPRTTFELIRKLERLYDVIKTEIKGTDDAATYDTAIELQKRVSEATSILNNYRVNLQDPDNKFTPIMFTYNTEEGSDYGAIKIIDDLSSYNTTIQSESTTSVPEFMTEKLFVGFLNFVSFNNDPIISKIVETYKKLMLTQFKTDLKDKTNNLLNEDFIIDGDISLPSVTVSNETYGSINELVPDQYAANLAKTLKDTDTVKVSYSAIDVTSFYLKLYKRKLEINEEKNVIAEALNEEINELVAEKLGMLPTIYNIFDIILTDVDHFFDIMRKTANDAETHHNNADYKKKILSGAGNTFDDVTETIYPFPLVLRTEEICGGEKKVKTVPVNLSDSLPAPFPEITLVDKFIESFIVYNDIVRILSMKGQKDGQGNVAWLPCNPADTVLVNPNQSSPYAGIDNPLSNIINTSEDEVIDQVLKIALNRFYVISQNTIRDSFYNEKTFYHAKRRPTEGGTYKNIFEGSEAVNIVSSVISQEFGQLLLERFKQYKSDPNAFYSYLENNPTFADLYSLPQNTDVLSISNGEPLYVNRKNAQYTGLEITDTRQINLRVDNPKKSKDPIDEFIRVNEFESFWVKRGVTGNYKYTDTNLIFFPDGDDVSGSAVNLSSKYVAENNINYKQPFQDSQESAILWWLREKDDGRIIVEFERTSSISHSQSGDAKYTPRYRDDMIAVAVDEGHSGLSRYAGLPKSDFVDNFDYATDLVKTWSINLTKFGDYILSTEYGDGDRNNTQNRFIRSLMYLSNFGWTLSPFSIFPYNLNRNIFTIPAVSEVPTFLLAYMGALVDIEGTQNYEDLYNFFTPPTSEAETPDSSGLLIFSDIHDIKKLSRKDKDTLKKFYEDFMLHDFSSVDDEVYEIYDKVFDNDSCVEENEKEKKINECRAELFDEELRDTTNIFRTLMKEKALVNLNQITFNQDDEDKEYYVSLEDSNTVTDTKEGNDAYFNNFFNRVVTDLEARIEFLENRENEFRRDVDDTDILTQTYYSFKNINDKWLAGLNSTTRGYPFKPTKDGKLIDQFAFVDRAMNPIGNTIINTDVLLDAEKDPNTSIFTVLTQLLSVNNFEFFPLQNFMSFENNEWEESFKITTGPIEKQFPTFVCMYLGGTSSYPTGIDTEFKDDGIIDLDNPGVADFNSSGCVPDTEADNQLETNEKFPYSQVKAFKVKFGQQNQSMFQNIEIDSKEYPETNESIQILSQIAGDGGEQAPIPKGQNLYNLYENRSYKATVSGFGNAMIQPTQYFQLENIPLFNGAYVILEVEHNITANNMKTSFSGTKLLKYPLPRVTEPATIFGFKGGNSEITQPRFETVTEGVGTSANPDKTKYNEFYFLKIGK